MLGFETEPLRFEIRDLRSETGDWRLEIGKDRDRTRNNLLRFCQSSNTDLTASLIPDTRIDELVTAITQDLQVCLCCRVIPHLNIHRGRDQYRIRSEERRVGRERRARWWRAH